MHKQKVTKLGWLNLHLLKSYYYMLSIISHRIDYNGIGF